MYRTGEEWVELGREAHLVGWVVVSADCTEALVRR